MDISILNWARLEATKLLSVMQADPEEKKLEYVEPALNGALDAFETLVKATIDKDGTSDYAAYTTSRVFLGRFMKELPLTPLKDDEWIDMPENAPGYFKGAKQHSRYNDLIKIETADGPLYLDHSRFAFYNVGDDVTREHPLVRAVAEEGFPISMPYLPSEKKIIIFYDEQKFGTDHVIAVTHYLHEGKLIPEKIGRFFKETPADECDYDMGEYGKYVEIDKEKYRALNVRIEKNRAAADVKKAEEVEKLAEKAKDFAEKSEKLVKNADVKIETSEGPVYIDAKEFAEKSEKLVKNAADAFVEAYKEGANNESEENN